MSYLDFGYGGRRLQEEIKRDSARLKQLEIERRMRLNKTPKEKLKSQPRKVRFEEEWDSGVRESRVRDKEKLDSSKKRVSLFDPENSHKLEERFEEIFAECYRLATKRGNRKSSQSPDASSCEQIPSKEAEDNSESDSKPPLEHKPETNQLEEIEVTAVEGELWVESIVPSLQEKEDEEILVQVDEPRVQIFPAVVDMGIEESHSTLIEEQVNKQETSTGKAEDVQVELKIVEVGHVDFVGVDRFVVHPNLSLIVFFNNLRRIEVQHGLWFEELWLTRRIKHRRYPKHVFEWQRRLKSRKRYPRVSCVEGWRIRVMHSQDSRTNLLEEEGNDMIQPSIKFNPIKKNYELLNESLIVLMCKDWAWKYKCLRLEFIMLGDARSSNDDHAFHGVLKDWAWKFKMKICLKIIQSPFKFQLAQLQGHVQRNSRQRLMDLFKLLGLKNKAYLSPLKSKNMEIKLGAGLPLFRPTTNYEDHIYSGP